MLDDFVRSSRVAYFSMEIALKHDIPTYAGGLGVLAGDTLRAAADLELPMVAVTLLSRKGYFRQELDESGWQRELPDEWQPATAASPLDAKVVVNIEGRRVWVGAWLYVVQSHLNGRQPVILLDTDLDENAAEDRALTDHLYGGDEVYRLKQEIILGIGGARMLQALGFEIRQYHLNEGHSALLGVELLRRHAFPVEDLRPGESAYDIPRVREMCNFTTHTPVEAGHDRFPYELVRRVLGDYIDLATLKRLAGDDALNMTRLALNLSDYVNGVAKRHAEVSRLLFPGYRVRAVTNGVHPHTWASPALTKLYDEYLVGWAHEPELLLRADCCIADAALWEAHRQAKQVLIERIKACNGMAFNPKVPIIGFARRMTAYKRPELLFSDLERLKAIAQQWPFQVVIAGKAHPRDVAGKQAIQRIHAHIRDLDGVVRAVFLPNYNMELALTMVAGVDVWLNTPLRPLEASGTSGMKAAFNGVPQLSVLDGWWVEGCVEGVTGWAIGNSDEADNGSDAPSLYNKLEQTVLPLYYQNKAGWVAVMKGAIAKSAAVFNAHRMMRRYAAEAYIR